MSEARIRAFRAELQGLKRQTRARLAGVLREVAYTVMENLTVGGAYSPGTPVDTSFARNQWHLVFVRDGQMTGVGAGNVESMGVAIAGIRDVTPIRFANNTEYIGPLEYGHSKQAPEGFVRLTLSAAQVIVDEAVRKINAIKRMPST